MKNKNIPSWWQIALLIIFSPLILIITCVLFMLGFCLWMIFLMPMLIVVDMIYGIDNRPEWADRLWPHTSV